MLEALLKYIDRVAVAISVLLNVLLLGNSNQTFSARNWQRKRDGKYHLCGLIDKLFWYQPDHCLTSWIYWRVRKDVMHIHETENTFTENAQSADYYFRGE